MPRGALITTAGFEDVLEIGRHNRRDVYGLRPKPPQTLIPRDRRLGVAERIAADGRIELALTEAEIARIATGSMRCRAETVAMCCSTPSSIRRMSAGCGTAFWAAGPRLPVTISSEISPEIREYERSSTTVLNALLMPVVRSYLVRLREAAARAGFRAASPPRPVEWRRVQRRACRRAAGAIAPLGPERRRACRAAPRAGISRCRDLVGIDMGGTSFDVFGGAGRPGQPR